MKAIMEHKTPEPEGLLKRSSHLVILKIKRSLEFIVYGLFDTLVICGTIGPRKDPRKVAIVQLELLGDYFLWRAYGQALAVSLKSSGKNVMLICNDAWAEIAESDFPDCEIFAISWQRFIRDIPYRARTIRLLHKTGTICAYHPSFPRHFIVQEAVVRALDCDAIGFDAMHIDHPRIIHRFCNRIYKSLVPPLKGAHQITLHKTYLNYLGIPNPSLLTAPALTIGAQSPACSYFIIAPGASDPLRRWPADQFAQLASRILAQNKALRCILVGTKQEAPVTKYIADALGDQSLDLGGQLTLTQLMSHIKNACFVISNDSATGHIASTFNIPCLALIGGGRFGSCYPYDSRESIYPKNPESVFKKMNCFGCNWICQYKVKPDGNYPCLEAITVDMAWTSAQKILREI